MESLEGAIFALQQKKKMTAEKRAEIKAWLHGLNDADFEKVINLWGLKS